MATYRINYLTGDSEIVDAGGVEYDLEARDYTFTAANGMGAVALAPAVNVRSIIRTDVAVTD